MRYVVITNRGCDDDVDCSPTCRGRKIERHEWDTWSSALNWTHHELFGCEARAGDKIDHRFDPFYEQLWKLKEPGGTLGPLPHEDMRIEIKPA